MTLIDEYFLENKPTFSGKIREAYNYNDGQLIIKTSNKISAYDFQEHHDIPAKILTENHLSSIDEIILGTSGTALLLGYYNSPFIKIFNVFIYNWHCFMTI